MDVPPPPPPQEGAGKPDRKTVERNRRNQMNDLYSRLDALVGSAPSPAQAGATATRPDRLEEATAYIRRTAERVQRLTERRRELTGGEGSSAGAVALPQIEVQHLGSGLHAILVTAPAGGGASFHRAVREVEEAGGEVQNAHFSVVGTRTLYTIHTTVAQEQGGIERVEQRLRKALRGDDVDQVSRYC